MINQSSGNLCHFLPERLKQIKESFSMDRNRKNLKPEAKLYDIPVRLIRYDKISGQVSYKRSGSDSVYTCYDYELNHVDGGIDNLRRLLNSLPGKDYE